MPMTCLVLGCNSRSNRDHISFYSVPASLQHRLLTNLNELSKRRRERWLAALKRGDLTKSILKNQRVCSKHFITGKPAPLKEENHPDWIPSQNMGHSLPALRRKSDVNIRQSLMKRPRALSVEIKQEVVEFLEIGMKAEEYKEQVAITADVSTQTDLTMEELGEKLDQLEFASKKIEELEKKLKEFKLFQDQMS